MEYLGLEETFKGLQVQPSCHDQGYLPTDQVAQSPAQPKPENFQEWGRHHLSSLPSLLLTGWQLYTLLNPWLALDIKLFSPPENRLAKVYALRHVLHSHLPCVLHNLFSLQSHGKNIEKASKGQQNIEFNYMENLFKRRLEKDFLVPLPIVTGQGIMALSSSRGGLD